MTTQITFSVRTNNEELLEKLDKDAKEQILLQISRSFNF
jgi:hypothetical protein